MRVKLLDFPISFYPSLEEKQTAEMFTRPESDRVVYWERHYHGLETSAFVGFFVGRATTMNRIDMSFEVRLSVNRLSISSVLDRAVTFKIWSEVLLQSWWTLFNIHHYYNCCMLLIKVILIDIDIKLV